MHTAYHTRLISRIVVLLLAGLSLLPLREVRAEVQGTPGTTKSTTVHRPKRMTPTKQKFVMGRGVFVGAGFEYRNMAGDFAKWLRSYGVAAANTKSKGQSTIIFQRVNHIQGIDGNDGLFIQIKSKKVVVNFTTDHALDYAVRLLKAMLVTDQGTPYWPGGTVTDWTSRTASRMEAVVDVATTMRPVKEMEGTVRRQASTSRIEEVYVTFVSDQYWRMHSPTLERADLTHWLYPYDGHYSRQEMLQIDQICRKNELEMIPTLELFSENAPFVNAFGHSVFSVEGMRFVRAAIEDCVEILRPKKICLGVMSDEVDVRYLEFVSGLAEMLEVELVIIDPDE